MLLAYIAYRSLLQHDDNNKKKNITPVKAEASLFAWLSRYALVPLTPSQAQIVPQLRGLYSHTHTTVHGVAAHNVTLAHRTFTVSYTETPSTQ